mmetsp:Transcript_61149/g.72598  ORF Transcript_61149/g.72598 Transcript_61149/m.72598 type:complete len:474 (+) Transcript_61149:72-1493(+)|eukprot:CAMPEP_0172499514 /NCGR_PEP_ID=MMETSP1066-20121228/128200_1 /TAXON_ID=671091 /ORGANISM="Coscinodiscus wailesii, Strain CCMP2513" /LENGTH=473 /DNA_ID=CAMNT_0013273297 /DNA_START=60 /DNA_END=1481 /DNA_ORIENTATION=+
MTIEPELIKDESTMHQSLITPDQNESNDNNSPSLTETIAGVAGNALEWYDFAIFGSFSDIIGKVFFPPSADKYGNILKSYIVFGVAFIARPVGGVIIGYVGDKFGRSTALQLSIFLMAFPTFALGLLPSYAKVGWLAPVLLVLVRLFQGLSVGGQLMSSLVFTLEKHPRQMWGFYGSIVFAASHIGALMGSLVSYVLRETLSNEQLENWGWRIPFLCGFVVVYFGMYLKKYSPDEHQQQQSDNIISGNGETVPRNPICEAVSREHLLSLLCATVNSSFHSVTFYISFVWMAIYMTDMVSPPVPQAFAVNSASMFLGIILIFPVGGTISDYIGRTKTMTFGALCLMFVGPIMVDVIGTGNPLKAFFAQTSLGVMFSFFGGTIGAWLVESFPVNIRLTALSISYNIGAGFMGGFSPTFATLMVESYGISSPGYLYTIFGFFALIGLCIKSTIKNEEDPHTPALCDENESESGVFA